MLKKYFAGASQRSHHTNQNFSLGTVKRFTSARRSSESEPLRKDGLVPDEAGALSPFPARPLLPPSSAVAHLIRPTSPVPFPNPPVCSHNWQPFRSTPTPFGPGPDTDQGARPPACLPVSAGEFWFSDGSLADRSKFSDPGLMPLPDTASGLDWSHLVDAARAFEGNWPWLVAAGAFCNQPPCPPNPSNLS